MADTDKNKILGAKLKYWRERRFLSVHALAKRTHVGEDTITGIEAGTRTPLRKTIEKLISPEGLNITLDQLADTADPERVLSAAS